MNHLISCVQNKTFIVEFVLSATILTHVRWGPEWLVWLETSNLRLAFFIFEMAVGLYFPMMGTMKGQIVPESGSKFAWRSFPQFCLCCLWLLWVPAIDKPFGMVGRGPRERRFTTCIDCPWMSLWFWRLPWSWVLPLPSLLGTQLKLDGWAWYLGVAVRARHVDAAKLLLLRLLASCWLRRPVRRLARQNQENCLEHWPTVPTVGFQIWWAIYYFGYFGLFELEQIEPWFNSTSSFWGYASGDSCARLWCRLASSRWAELGLQPFQHL